MLCSSSSIRQILHQGCSSDLGTVTHDYCRREPPEFSFSPKFRRSPHKNQTAYPRGQGWDSQAVSTGGTMVQIGESTFYYPEEVADILDITYRTFQKWLNDENARPKHIPALQPIK